MASTIPAPGALAHCLSGLDLALGLALLWHQPSIPAVQVFSTAADGQTSVEINVLQACVISVLPYPFGRGCVCTVMLFDSQSVNLLSAI